MLKAVVLFKFSREMVRLFAKVNSKGLKWIQRASVLEMKVHWRSGSQNVGLMGRLILGKGKWVVEA